MKIDGQGPWRLRWCFDYHDKPTRTGAWNSHKENDPHASALMQTKSGLMFAAIEAQDRDKTKIVRLCECVSSEFCNFEWVATASVSPHFKNGAEQVTRPVIVGLKIVTRNNEITVFVNGDIETSKRQYEDKLFHYGRI